MTRLEYLLSGDFRTIRHPEDVARLKASIPEIALIPDSLVQKFYEDWSEDYYAAGWLTVDDETIEDFAGYLRMEK